MMNADDATEATTFAGESVPRQGHLRYRRPRGWLGRRIAGQEFDFCRGSVVRFYAIEQTWGVALTSLVRSLFCRDVDIRRAMRIRYGYLPSMRARRPDKS